MLKILTATTDAVAALASPLHADGIDIVRAFYSDILTDPAGTTPARYFELFSPKVVSSPAAKARKAC